MARIRLEMSAMMVLRSAHGLGRESPTGAHIQSKGLMSRKDGY